MAETIIRPMQKKDHSQIIDIINKTWGYEKLCGNAKAAKRMSALYLHSCLAQQNCATIAAKDDDILGIIMTRNDKACAKPNLKIKLTHSIKNAKVIATKAGRNAKKIYENVLAVNDELLCSTGKNFDGELTFFAVEENARGMGIGRQLLQKAISQLRAEKLKNIYVFTDSACDYSFYDAHQFIKVGEKNYSVLKRTGSKFMFYIYEYIF